MPDSLSAARLSVAHPSKKGCRQRTGVDMHFLQVNNRFSAISPEGIELHLSVLVICLEKVHICGYL